MSVAGSWAKSIATDIPTMSAAVVATYHQGHRQLAASRIACACRASMSAMPARASSKSTVLPLYPVCLPRLGGCPPV